MTAYRLLVSGWRFYPDSRRAIVVAALDAHLRDVQSRWPGRPVVLVHGAATGLDTIAAVWAARTPGVTPEPHPADWARCGDDCPAEPHRKTNKAGYRYCPGAGPRRNRLMASLGADWLIAFPGPRAGRSGTRDMVKAAREAGIQPTVHEWDGRVVTEPLTTEGATA